MKALCGLAIFLFLLPCISRAQNIPLKKIEDDLKGEFSLLNSLDPDNETSYDSSEIISDAIRAKIKYYSALNPDMIRDTNIPPNKLISEDGRFRIYFWEEGSGGSMSFYYTIYQYEYGGKLYTRDTYDSTLDGPQGNGTYYSHLYTLNTGASAIYLAQSMVASSHHDGREGIRLFCIDSNFLNDTLNLIQANGGMVNSLDVEYDIFKTDISDFIRYDPAERTIYTADLRDDGSFTGKYLRYRFNGKYFDAIGAK